MVHVLPDGARFEIRPIRPDDKDRLEAGIRALSEETIHRRFLAAKPRLSGSELRYLTEVDGHDHIALVAISMASGRLVAVARCVRVSPGTAEWAVVVADELQGRGLGRLLTHQLVDAAGREGIHRFTATMLGENLAARRLARAVADRFEERMSGGLREIVVEVAA